MKVEIGLGYIKDSKDNIVAKYDLPKGDHPLREGFSFVEVNSQEELDQVEIYVAPKSAEETEAQEKEKLIQEKIRAMAISALQAENKLDESGKIIKEG